MQGLMQDDWPLVVTKIIDYAAKFHGEQEIVSRNVEGTTTVCTYRELHQRASLCTLALRRLGVRPGDRVATLAWNTTRHLESWYGISGAGCVCHTLNPRLFDKDLEYIINNAEDVVILADVSFVETLERLAPRIPTVKHIVFLTADAYMPKQTSLQNPLCYDDLLEEEVSNLPGFKWSPCKETDAVGLCYTSGTTGLPKGVLYSHRANFLHALAVSMPDALNLSSRTSFLMVVPMFHANSWGIAHAAPMVGARLVLPGPNLDGASVHEMIQTHAVTHTASVPTVSLGLLEHMERTRGKLSTLEVMVVGGSACPRHVIEYFQGKHGVNVVQLWGMTETCPCGTVGAVKGTMLREGLTPEGDVNFRLKQGRPHIFMDMRIVGEGGKELPHDGKAFGDLQVRGPIALKQYFKVDKPAVDSEGWFNTGDVATLDPYGYMQITDRSKDVIKSGGEWISSIEIENVAMGHPGVAEAAVIGIADEKWGERPLLVVVRSEGKGEGKGEGGKASKPVSKEEVLKFLEGKIARWWMPDDVVFIKEIPHTATGKTSKLSLRQQLKDYKPLNIKAKL